MASTPNYLVFFGQGISREMVLAQLAEIVEKNIKHATINPTSFMTRVLVFNNLLKGASWYLLTLWTCIDEDLNRLETIAMNFFVGRPKGECLS